MEINQVGFSIFRYLKDKKAVREKERVRERKREKRDRQKQRDVLVSFSLPKMFMEGSAWTD